MKALRTVCLGLMLAVYPSVALAGSVVLQPGMLLRIDFSYPGTPSLPYYFAEQSNAPSYDFAPGEAFTLSLYDGNDALFARHVFTGCGSCSYSQAFSQYNAFSPQGSLTTVPFYLVIDQIVGTFDLSRINLMWYGLLDLGGGATYPDYANAKFFGADGSDFQVSTVPEPTSLFLLGTGLVSVAARVRRKRG